MTDERADDLRLAIAAAQEAGKATLARFRRPMEVTHKSVDQPVTASDLEADRILRQRIGEARPDDGWLSEETQDDPARLGKRRVWIVDPLDGTRSYVAGRPEYAVSVGLAEDGIAVVGVVYDPASGELYWATRGGGAWKTDAPADAPARGQAQRIHVREARPGEPPAMLASRSEIRSGEFAFFGDGWQLAPLGSTAYKLAKLAEGAAQAFVSRGPKSEWDVCAGGLLVEEAGGRITDLRGDPLRYDRPDPSVYGVVASNGALQARLLAMVARMPAPERLTRRAADPLHPGFEDEEE